MTVWSVRKSSQIDCELSYIRVLKWPPDSPHNKTANQINTFTVRRTLETTAAALKMEL